MPRPTGSKNAKPAGVRINARVNQRVAEWLKSTGNITGTIERLCEDVMNSIEKESSVCKRLEELGYNSEQIDIITRWWDASEHYDWLMAASKNEIDAATKEAF